MKLNIILLLALPYIFCACNKVSKEEETARNLKETLIVEEYTKEIDSLKAKLTANQKTIDSLIKLGSNNNGIINSSYKNASVKEVLFRFIINGLNLDNYTLANALFENSISRHILIDSDYWIGSDFIKHFNRSTEFITEYFGNAEIALITNLLEENDLYFKAGIDIMVEGLLTAYDEFNRNPQLLAKAIQCKDNYEEYHELLESMYSKKEDLLTQMLGCNKNHNSLFMIYSFWVRRHHEGNSEVIYSLLKNVHSRISKVNRVDFLSFDKKEVISQILEEDFSTDDFDKNTFNFLFVELKAHTFPFEDFIAYNPIFIPRTLEADQDCYSSLHYIDRGIDTPDYMCKLNRMYSEFDRTSDNILKVFNEKALNHIASLFNYKILPKNYKLFGLLEGLLMTYEEMDNEECERLYQLLHLKEVDWNYSTECDEAFEDKVSNRVKDYVTATPYVQYYDNSSAGYEKRMFYLYSFWARRYNEGNKEAVYQILERLHEKIN